MTDPLAPRQLVLAAPPIATATDADGVAFLTGEGLRLVIAERLRQIEVHGHTARHDALHDQAELALAAKSYLDTYIDLALRPAQTPSSVPESWAWADLFWKEPTPDRIGRALVKAIALALAELDRHIAAMDLIRAARPLIDYEQPATPDAPGAGRWHL